MQLLVSSTFTTWRGRKFVRMKKNEGKEEHWSVHEKDGELGEFW